MTLVMVGANPRRAPFFSLRRSLGPGAAGDLAAAVAGRRGVSEAFVLVGAERLEAYAVLEEGVDGYELLSSLWGAPGVAAPADGAAHGYFAEGIDAASHLFAAVAGADEFAGADEDGVAVLDAAVGAARQRGTVGSQLEALADGARALAARLAAARAEESATALGETVAALAQRVFDHLDRRQVLLVGDDSLLGAAAAALTRAGVTQFALIGDGPAVRCAGGVRVSPEALPVALGNADVVVAAPGTVPVLDKRLVRTAVRARRGRPMLLVDASDRGGAIDPRVAGVDDAFLYNRDDLARLTQDAPWARAGGVRSREALVAAAVRDFSYQLA